MNSVRELLTEVQREALELARSVLRADAIASQQGRSNLEQETTPRHESAGESVQGVTEASIG